MFANLPTEENPSVAQSNFKEKKAPNVTTISKIQFRFQITDTYKEYLSQIRKQEEINEGISIYMRFEITNCVSQFIHSNEMENS